VRRQSFIFFVAASVLACVFLMIYKQAYITKLLYEQQTLEKEHAELTATYARLTQELYRLKNPAVVQDYALKSLGMKKVALAQARNARVHTIKKGDVA